MSDLSFPPHDSWGNPHQPSNRIDVDLRVLQDETIQRLEQFGSDFRTTVEDLKRVLTPYSEQARKGGGGLGGANSVAGMADVVTSRINNLFSGVRNLRGNRGGGGGDDGGSTGGGAQGGSSGGGGGDNSVAGSGGGGTAGGGGGGGGDPTGGTGGASVAPGGPEIVGRPPGRFQRQSSAPAFLSEFQRSQFRLGNFPSYGAAQALMVGSWLSGEPGWEQVPGLNPQQMSEDEIKAYQDAGYLITPDSLHVYKPSGGGFAKNMRGVSTVTGDVAQTILQGQHVYEAINNILPGGLNVPLDALIKFRQTTNSGISAGYSRAGWLGTSFMSPAFKAGFGAQIDALKKSWFGFNPNYSTAQADAAQQAIINSGWFNSPNAGFLASTMRKFQQNFNMDPNQVAQILDPLMRFGGATSQDELSSILNLQVSPKLKELGAAAQAAHIGLQQMTQSLTQAALQVDQQTGMDTGTATTSLMALSAATGIDPQTLATNMMTPDNLIMGAALTHRHISDVIMRGQGVDSAAMAMPMTMMQNIMGMSFPQFQALQKSNPAAAKGVLDRLTYAWMKNPQLFGGLNMRQTLAQLAKGVNPGVRAQALDDVLKGRGFGREGANKEFGADLTKKQDIIQLLKQEHPDWSASQIQQAASKQIHQGQLAGTAGILHDIAEFGGPAAGKLREQFLKYDAQGIHSRGDEQNWLARKMQKIMGNSNLKAAHTVTMVLDPEARKILRFLKSGTGDKNSDTGNSSWRKAIDMGESVGTHIGKGALDFATGGLAAPFIGM